MARLLRGRTWARDFVGESGSLVYRLRGQSNEPDLYLKLGRGPAALDVTDEMVRLNWLARYVPVPAVQHFVASPDEAWLLMTGLPGRTAYQLLQAEPENRASVVDALARFLRRLHDIPAENCPFNSDRRLRLSQARERMVAGLVDVDDFNDEHKGWTAQEVWNEMIALQPFAPDPVVTHGDFSLDNILLEGQEIAGCIDVGRVGIADRYQDLAILWNCLGEFDATLQQRLLATYGIDQPDKSKLRFHLGLDEFF